MIKESMVQHQQQHSKFLWWGHKAIYCWARGCLVCGGQSHYVQHSNLSWVRLRLSWAVSTFIDQWNIICFISFPNKYLTRPKMWSSFSTFGHLSDKISLILHFWDTLQKLNWLQMTSVYIPWPMEHKLLF